MFKDYIKASQMYNEHWHWFTSFNFIKYAKGHNNKHKCVPTTTTYGNDDHNDFDKPKDNKKILKGNSILELTENHKTFITKETLIICFSFDSKKSQRNSRKKL